MKWFKRLVSVVLLLALAGGLFLWLRPAPAPLVAESDVDLDRYLGTWYVIANIPYFAERGKVASRSEYRLRDDGRLDDVYFYREAFGEAEQSMEGVAWVTDTESHARWKVRFLWPLTFDYVILDVDEAYRYAAVGHPSRNYGWVMAREPRMPEAEYRRLLRVFEANGYDSNDFFKVPQFPDQVGRDGFQ